MACPSAECAVLAQAAGGAGRLLKPPAEPARLLFTDEPGLQSMLWRALLEGVTCLTDFLGHTWRPRELPADEHHFSPFPQWKVGTMRTALYQDMLVTEVSCSLQENTSNVEDPHVHMTKSQKQKQTLHDETAPAWHAQSMALLCHWMCFQGPAVAG